MNDAIMPKVLNFITVASLFGKKAVDAIAAARAAEKAAVDRQPEMLQFLLDAKAVQPTQKEAAAKMLSTHTGAMELLKSAVSKWQETREQNVKQAASLGSGVPPASPTAPEPFVGARSSGNRPSDIALLQGLGLPC